MYSKSHLDKLIEQRLGQMGLTRHALAKQLGMSSSNLSRALHEDRFHLTLPQFAALCEALEFTSEQITWILTGKKAKEATLQLIRQGIDDTLNAMK